MSGNNIHIINKQVIEIHLPKDANSLETQEAVGKLYVDQFMPIISSLLDKHFKNKDEYVKIENLSIDLGQVSLENITNQFSKAFDKSLLNITNSKNESKEITTKSTLQKTPFKVIAYYLIHGRLPWWAKNTKLFIQQQLEVLLHQPTAEFVNMLTTLPTKTTYLKRYVTLFSEEQLSKSIALLTNISSERIVKLRHQVESTLKEHTNTTISHSQSELTNIFYNAVFKEINLDRYKTKSKDKTKILTLIQNNVLKRMALDLGIFIEKATDKGELFKELYQIRTVIKKLKSKRSKHKIWQDFFNNIEEQLRILVVDKLPLSLVKEFRELLENVEAKEIKIGIVQEKGISKTTVLSKEFISNLFLPIHKQLVTIVKATKKAVKDTPKLPLEKTSFEFEETDFMTIENAGLVLLWPFLQRFFENLNVIEEKCFIDEGAKNKAVSILHYICNSDENELFEGILPLTKILCGIAVEDPVEHYNPSEEEKEIANNFLDVIIQHGKCWGTISKEGFRASYLLRQASLRIRDDHWLVQVKKETYDVILQKLPWSFNAIKLPWMEKLIMVEWM